jgi:uroporphyrinogen decarboxylase
MNTRERFLEVLAGNPDVRSLKWEFGYWGETVDNWYAAGLPRVHYPELQRSVTTPTSSLYLPAWRSVGAGALPKGIAVLAGGLYWPTQAFPLDHDVRRHFGMDACQQVVDVNLLFDPLFEIKVGNEDAEVFDYVDIDGVQRRFLKEHGTIPFAMKWPIEDRASWERLKEERLNLKNIRTRFPADWEAQVRAYKDRDYPLALGGYPHGFFGTLAHLIGYENLFTWYLTEPELIHDILNTFTDLWLAVYEEVLTRVSIDHWQIWEDVSYGRGSMISPRIVREFILPYIRKIGAFLNAHGVRHILLDTDGNCYSLIPLFLEAGVTGMYPFEVHCGMDVARVRKLYPEMQILGGIPKSEIAQGKQRIDEILEVPEAVLRTGRYIPFGDHLIPPEVDFDNFTYYRNRLNRIIDRGGY